ncbi:MAG: hypothetical protein NC248_08260 [Bacteroides sp.]|nr:hypothetical protein [Lachnospiraceae bacterium]MCM1332587.1 hypothetical protein [Bacteroides sp.]MCM1390932.1 hypothetical protein [Bacteroides sp.]
MMGWRQLLLLLPAFVFSGCFTGIESTPKITSTDVKRQQVGVTEEDEFLSDINSQRLSQWKKGKRFYVTDDKIVLALEPTGNPPKAGEYINFDSYRPVTSLTGTEDTELIFSNKDGGEIVYRISASREELENRTKVDVPFTIDMDVVDKASDMLLNKRLYLKSPVRYDRKGNSYNGVKFVPVTITEVLPGNVVYQVMVKFKTDDAQSSGEEAYLFLNVGDAGKSTRNFATLFYFNDPRLKYPLVTDENWRHIQQGRVVPYMTREECKLALGAPASVSRRNAISTIQELWSYPNGNYLIFEDGILRSVRR